MVNVLFAEFWKMSMLILFVVRRMSVLEALVLVLYLTIITPMTMYVI